MQSSPSTLQPSLLLPPMPYPPEMVKVNSAWGWMWGCRMVHGSRVICGVAGGGGGRGSVQVSLLLRLTGCIPSERQCM